MRRGSAGQEQIFFEGSRKEIASPREATLASARERIRVGGCVAVLGNVPPGASLGAVTRARACEGEGYRVRYERRGFFRYIGDSLRPPKFLRAFAETYLARRRTPALTARGDCVAGDVHRDGRDRGRHVESA